MTAIDLRMVVRFLVRLSDLQREWDPSVFLSAFYEGSSWSLPKKRMTYVSTLTFTDETRRLKSFSGYCEKLGLSPEELLDTKIFNLVSYAAEFHSTHYGLRPERVYKDASQHFAVYRPDGSWRAWEGVIIPDTPNRNMWDDQWAPYELTDEQRYTIDMILLESYVPLWIAERYGNYQAFAKAACRMFRSESPRWWAFRRGDFYNLYERGLRMFVFTLQQLREGKPLRSSDTIMIANPLDNSTLGVKLARLMQLRLNSTRRVETQ